STNSSPTSAIVIENCSHAVGASMPRLANSATNPGFGSYVKWPEPLPPANQPSQVRVPADLTILKCTVTPDPPMSAAERPTSWLMGTSSWLFQLSWYRRSPYRMVSRTVAECSPGSISHCPSEGTAC